MSCSWSRRAGGGGSRPSASRRARASWPARSARRGRRRCRGQRCSSARVACRRRGRLMSRRLRRRVGERGAVLGGGRSHARQHAREVAAGRGDAPGAHLAQQALLRAPHRSQGRPGRRGSGAAPGSDVRVGTAPASTSRCAACAVATGSSTGRQPGDREGGGLHDRAGADQRHDDRRSRAPSPPAGAARSRWNRRCEPAGRCRRRSPPRVRGAPCPPSYDGSRGRPGTP